MNQNNYQLAVKLRHELHAHPELSNQEIWTKAHLISFLKEHTKHLDIIDKGAWFYAAYRAGEGKPGIAFRADFDAVPVQDGCTEVYAAKTPGVGHKCGHDGHSACLAALALEIDQKGADKNVFFLFQHAEEIGDGAKECVALFQDEQVDEIYGFHNRPGIPAGTVQVLDGCIYCASKGMIIAYQGVPSHASTPEVGRNPAYAISNLIQKLGDLTAAGKHRGLVLATIIQVNVGERAFGTQASQGELLLTIRGQYEEELQYLQDSLETMAKQEAEQFGLGLEISYCDVFPVTNSHKECNDKLRAACAELGITVREMPAPYRGSEDFGHYTKEIPGAFFEIGTGEDRSDLHTVEMDFNDEIIPVAVAIYQKLI